MSLFSGKQNVLIIYQPHQQQRLEKLFDDFVRVFGEARLGTGSQIIITDIYEVAGREINHKIIKARKHKNKNAEILVSAINKKYPKANVIYVPRKELRNYLRYKIQDTRYKILVFAGAGDIDDFARKFIVS